MGARKSISNSAVAQRLFMVACVLLVGAVAPRALADPVLVLTVLAENESGQGTYEWTVDPGLRGDPWCDIILEEPVDIVDSTTQAVVATLNELAVCYNADPEITLHFSVVAGFSTTNFTITSALQAIAPPIANAQARATSAMSVSDGLLGGGATLTGLLSLGNAYEAAYNGYVTLPAHSTFSTQIQQIVADEGRSNSRSENDPSPTGFRAMGATCSDMSAQIKFSLTPKDLASGDTTYVITPEPAALWLLAVGAAGLRWRRRL